jgi:hypothetical protein
MKIKTLKKVETIEEFRNTLLKLFYSNKEKRELYVRLGNDNSDFLSVDDFNSFKDIIKLSCVFDIQLTPKVDNLYFKKRVPRLDDINKLGNIEIIEDEMKFLELVKIPLWININDRNLTFLIENVFDKSFHM